MKQSCYFSDDCKRPVTAVNILLFLYSYDKCLCSGPITSSHVKSPVHTSPHPSCGLSVTCTRRWHALAKIYTTDRTAFDKRAPK